MTNRIVGSGNPLQILNNILVKTDQGRVKLSSTNLEIGVNTWVGGKVEEEGGITVPARIMNEYINNLPTEKVVISTKNNDLTLESENYHTNIKGLPAEDFPLIPQILEEAWANIDSEELRLALSETIWASSQNETQPEISGVYMMFEGKTLRLAATDRYRLAERTVNLTDSAPGTKEVIVPARTVSELYKILGLGGGAVEVYFSESQVLFKFDQTEITSRLIDGTYPDYRQIVPKEFKSEAKVQREELMHALKAASLFAPESNNIQISLDKDGLIITAASAQAGENTTLVPAQMTGDKNTATFNFRYLLDCLTNLTEAAVVFKMINDTQPAALVPEGRDNYLYIVMPIKL